jgi:hypothetical protein
MLYCYMHDWYDVKRYWDPRQLAHRTGDRKNPAQ